MDSWSLNYIEKRSVGRRKEDFLIREQILQHNEIFKFGKIILSETNLETLLDLIIEQTIKTIGVERCSIFLHDIHSDNLWTIVATGVEKNVIRVPSDKGVAGWVFKNMDPVVVNDAYADRRFCSDIDIKTGFRTKNILCVPLVKGSDNCIGVLQALNKIKDNFTDQDKAILISISHYVSIAIENAKLYEELKLLNEARQKVIDHLSHEMRTPVAIINTAINRISKEIGSKGNVPMQKALARCERNLKRLLNIQEKNADILNLKLNEDKDKISHLIETFFSLIEELEDTDESQLLNTKQTLLNRLEAIYIKEPVKYEKIHMEELIFEICNDASNYMDKRVVEIHPEIENNIYLEFDRSVLKKVLSGLLKNAIEATPDEGKVSVRLRAEEQNINVEVQDWGVGITPNNQKNIFSGFFHTQDTDYYASKKPYAFYAGGSGSDLLRMKVFSERYNFSISFESRCCGFIPGVKNMCPGRISKCQYINSYSECKASGGSVFSVRFPFR